MNKGVHYRRLTGLVLPRGRAQAIGRSFVGDPVMPRAP